MVSHVFAALTKKRTDLAEKEKGFTLIELLVTVIIIGVLAAIAIPVYLNVQGGAKDSAVKSDLTNAKTAVIASQTENANGTLPTTGAAGTAGAFLTVSPAPPKDNYTDPSDDTPLTYTTDGLKAFCIYGVSASGEAFAISDSKPATKGQQCAATGVMENYTAPEA